ncbi:MAG TPA: hypothetical protein VFW05_10380 [Verrucomicrobiae bacterium]|jgi:hypothetical protein|nr:hypothetical protein [Verrucomicrobiae bacterium]
MDEPLETETRRKYIWPWIALGTVLLAVVLAVAWMTVAVERVRKSRIPNTESPIPGAVSNSPAAIPSADSNRAAGSTP